MSDASPTTSESDSPPWPLTAFTAWLLPGLGHYLMGYRRRGIIVGATIIALFTAGLLVGGVSVVDSDDQRLWFTGQALIGPAAFGVNIYRRAIEGRLHHQLDEFAQQRGRNYTYGRSNDADRGVLHAFLETDTRPAYTRSLGRVHELGTLYCTLAGVLNLLVILDVIGRSSSAPIHPAPPPHDQPDSRRHAGRPASRPQEGQP